MKLLTFKNLQFRQFNGGNNKEAAIVTHGGYTPRRGPVRTGSGKSTVPSGITLNFYAPADTVCVGTQAFWKVSTGTCNNPVVETCTSSNPPTENYSLTHDDKVDSWTFNDSWTIDLITVSSNKAHLNDIWDGLSSLSLNYTVIHCFCCRINKLTYSDEIK